MSKTHKVNIEVPCVIRCWTDRGWRVCILIGHTKQSITLVRLDPTGPKVLKLKNNKNSLNYLKNTQMDLLLAYDTIHNRADGFVGVLTELKIIEDYLSGIEENV